MSRDEGPQVSAQRVSITSSDGVILSVAVDTCPASVGETVILAHGLQGNKESSERYENGFHVALSKRLVSSRYRVIRFDFRGHGESEGKQEDVTLSGEVADLSAIVRWSRRQGARNVGIVATSFAGGVAVIYAAQNPGKVGPMVLLHPAWDYQRNLLETKPFWLDDELSEEASLELREKGFLLHHNFRMGRCLINEAKIIRPCQFISRVTCPVLTIHGDQDSIIPYAMSKRYHRFNEQSQLLTLEGADHGPSVLWTPKQTETAIDAISKWFGQFLGISPDPHNSFTTRGG